MTRFNESLLEIETDPFLAIVIRSETDDRLGPQFSAFMDIIEKDLKVQRWFFLDQFLVWDGRRDP
jgi:hypothetical protein